MALQSSGYISLSDLRSEFDGGTPVSIAEYYKGGYYVQDIDANLYVPESGPISLSDFYGAQAVLPDYTSYFSDATVDDLTYAVWSPPLGSPGCEVSYTNPLNDGSGLITRGGVYTIGEIYPIWVGEQQSIGGGGNMEGNTNYLAGYLNLYEGRRPEDYPYLVLSLYTDLGESTWTIENPVFSSISGIASYMSSGTIVDSTGALAASHPADVIAYKLSGDGPNVTAVDLSQQWRFTFNP